MFSPLEIQGVKSFALQGKNINQSCVKGDFNRGAAKTGGGHATCANYIIKSGWKMPKDYPKVFKGERVY